MPMDILISGAWKEAKHYIKTIENMGHIVHFLQWEQDELPCDPGKIEGVIANNLFRHHAVEEFSKLAYVQTTSAGLDRQPMDYFRNHQITVYNARGVYSIPMAEYALAGVLAIYKKQAVFRDKQSNHIWEKQRDLTELYGKTVCVLGCGSVGTECAKRFKAIGCHVTGLDTDAMAKAFHDWSDIKKESMKASPMSYQSDHGYFEYYQNIVPLSLLGEELQTADIIIISLPLTEKTWHLFNSDIINNLKRDSILVNISRGPVVDTGGLVQALADPERKLRAVLDVFEEEPLGPDNPLWDMENVIITPHNSFVGNNNQERLSRLIMKNLETFRGSV